MVLKEDAFCFALLEYSSDQKDVFDKYAVVTFHFAVPTRSPLASEFCLVASGDAVFAGGEQIQVTRREASDCQLSAPLVSPFFCTGCHIQKTYLVLC